MLNIIKKNWGRFSDACGGGWIYWNASSQYMELLRLYRNVFKTHMHRDDRVLDLGAGKLVFRALLKQHSSHYESLDFTKTHPELDYIGTTSNTHRPDASYDVVFCNQVLEHVPDPASSFQEIHRILRPGGTVILSVPFLMYLHNEPYDFFRYTRYALEKFAKDAGFEILELREIGGIFAFAGRVLAMLFVGSTWHVPLLNRMVALLNVVIQRVLFWLDQWIPSRKIFPSDYVMVLRRRTDPMRDSKNP